MAEGSDQKVRDKSEGGRKVMRAVSQIFSRTPHGVGLILYIDNKQTLHSRNCRKNSLDFGEFIARNANQCDPQAGYTASPVSCRQIDKLVLDGVNFAR